RDTLPDPDAVGIGEPERAVDMDVDVDPARRQVLACEVDDLRTSARPGLAHGFDAPAADAHVGDPVDPLCGIDHMRTLQDQHVVRSHYHGRNSASDDPLAQV